MIYFPLHLSSFVVNKAPFNHQMKKILFFILLPIFAPMYLFLNFFGEAWENLMDD